MGEIVDAIHIAPPVIIWEIILRCNLKWCNNTRLESGAVDMPSVLGNIEGEGDRDEEDE